MSPKYIRKFKSFVEQTSALSNYNNNGVSYKSVCAIYMCCVHLNYIQNRFNFLRQFHLWTEEREEKTQWIIEELVKFQRFFLKNKALAFAKNEINVIKIKVHQHFDPIVSMDSEFRLIALKPFLEIK